MAMSRPPVRNQLIRAELVDRWTVKQQTRASSHGANGVVRRLDSKYVPRGAFQVAQLHQLVVEVKRAM
jgi:hypothetical protein